MVTERPDRSGREDVGHRAPGNPTTGSAPHRIAKLAALTPVHGRWLDVGCGAGDYTQLLTEHGTSFSIGIDVGLRHPLMRNERDAFCAGASERLPFASGSFDGALLNEVLEHVDDERETLSEIRRVLRPDGRLIVFSPNRWFPFEGHGAIIGRHEIDFPVPGLPWLPNRLSRRWMRARNYWPRELRARLEDAGFVIDRTEFAYPLFVEVRWLPEPLAARVRDSAPRLETTRAVRRFGVSTMLVARPAGRPTCPTDEGGGITRASLPKPARLRDGADMGSPRTSARPRVSEAEGFRPVQVLAVDVDQPFAPTLGGCSSTREPYGFALLLARLHGVPLGTLEVDLRDGTVAGEELRDMIVARFGAAIDSHLAEDRERGVGASVSCGRTRRGDPQPPVSVVLATFRRPDLIGPCLESVLASDYSDFEVIVVDNAPDDPRTREVVERRFAGEPRLRYLAEERPGTSFARNTGIAAANADLVAITDDDVIVDPKWLANLVAAMGEDDGVACVTGLTLPAELETQAQVWFEELGGMGQGFRTRAFSLDMDDEPTLLFPFTPAVGASNNMMIRRSVAAHLRGFDVRLGPGTPTHGGEDLDLFVRVLLDRRSIVYAPAALVWHRHRSDVAALRRHVYGYGVGSVSVLTKWFFREPVLRQKVRRNALRLPAAFALSSSAPRDTVIDLPRNIGRARAAGAFVGPVAWMRSAAKAAVG